MDCFVLAKILIERIWNLDRAIFYANGTAGAFVLNYVSWFLNQRYIEITSLTVNALDLSICQDLYVWVPADLDQLGRKNSHRAVVGRIGLVKLGHMPADGRRFFDQIDPVTSSCQIKRSLNAADSAADDHYVSKFAIRKALTQLFNLFFKHWSFFLLHNLIRVIEFYIAS